MVWRQKCRTAFFISQKQHVKTFLDNMHVLYFFIILIYFNQNQIHYFSFIFVHFRMHILILLSNTKWNAVFTLLSNNIAFGVSIWTRKWYEDLIFQERYLYRTFLKLLHQQHFQNFHIQCHFTSLSFSESINDFILCIFYLHSNYFLFITVLRLIFLIAIEFVVTFRAFFTYVIYFSQ